MTRPVPIRAVAQLADDWIDAVLCRAGELAEGAEAARSPCGRIGLVFLDTSLRTRVGFEAAAGRLGAQAIVVDASRANPKSMPEHWSHTVRTVAGYVDGLVVRLPVPLDPALLPPGITVPIISGGDGGQSAEHPTQALIDLFAIERLRGPVADLTVGVQGDLRMRAVRSLLAMFARRPPRQIVLVTESALRAGFEVPDALTRLVQWRTPEQITDVDVLYAAGIPHGSVDEDARSRLRVTPRTLQALPTGAIVLSPLPAIDEIDAAAFTDLRVSAFTQSDLGLHVRTAVLERMLAG